MRTLKNSLITIMMFRLWERATRRDSGPEVFQNFLTLLSQPVCPWNLF